MAKIAFFDIEADNLIPKITTLHVAVVKGVNEEPKMFYTVKDLIAELNKYDIIVGHNCLAFDIPALTMISGIHHSWIKPVIHDTCVMSRLLWPDRAQHPAGGSSLEAWGKHLGLHKGDHTDFTKLSPEMIAYCIQDVLITEQIYNKLLPLVEACPHAFNLELSTARIVGQQIGNGFGFSTLDANCLMADLNCQLADVTEALRKAFPPKEIPLKTKVKYVDFNPGSRDMIAAALIKKYKWRPTEFTETGKPKIDETVLDGLDYPEAAILSKYFMLDKRKSQLESWLEAEHNGRIHGSVNTNGAVSGRMTHSGPNMAQVPRCGSPLGYECRSLFRPTNPNWVQVGADASGLELRMFAHYLAAFDNGAYAKVVCEGDVHTHNQTMAGLKTRDQAKTFIYGLLYGAGDAKVGKIVDGTISDGTRLKNQFKRQVPAYAKLLNQLEYVTAQRGFLRGLDSRPLPVRSAHSALNLLLQSAGAVVMKQALVILNDRLNALYPGRYAFMANVHDEWQIECDRDISSDVGRIACESITEAGVVLNLQCPLKGEYKIGNNWAETH